MNSSPISPAEQERALAQQRRRNNLLLLLVAAATVMVPYLFWRETWFGGPLTDQQLEEYLADREKPRNAQHALVQIAERIERGDPSAQRWYPEMAALHDSPVAELRVTVAWALGSDNHSDLFHQTLLSLLRDPASLVRRNAALSLVRFGDTSGKDEILAIFRPVSVTSPAAGVLTYRTQEGASVEPNGQIATVQPPGGASVEVRASAPGKVQPLPLRDGASVQQNQELLTLSPPDEHVWEALRALYLIGQPQDLTVVEAFTAPQYSDKIRQQASLTTEEIKRRPNANPSNPVP